MKNPTHEQTKKELLRSRAERVIQKNAEQSVEKIYEKSPQEIERLFYELSVHKIELEMQNEELQIAQTELENSLKRYYDLYNMAPVGYCIMSREEVITEVNLTAMTMLGVTKDSIIKKPLTHFVFRDDQDTFYLHCKKFIETSEPHSCELRMKRGDGTPFWAYLSGSLIKNDDNVSLLHIVIHDITERKKMEDELHIKEEIMIAQSRQAAMGDMISMIAHQWRQPLAVIAMSVNNINLSLELDGKITQEEYKQCADTVSEHVLNLSTTIDNFRNYFQPNQPKKETAMEDVLKDTLGIIGKCLENSNITLHIQNSSTCRLWINKSSLIQVLLNILENAKETLISREVARATVNIRVNETKEYVTISICDNAGGIQESIIDKISEPYFTTKEELNGSGLGIYISRTIVEKHLFGTLSWHNEVKGACFVISLKINHDALP